MSTPAEAQKHLGNVYKRDETDEEQHQMLAAEDHKVEVKPITVGQFMHGNDSEVFQRKALENTIVHMSENLTRDNWSTIRYAMEEYLQKCERELKALMDGSASHISDRKPGHFEEIALAADLVRQTNEVLMHFRSCQSEYGVDL